MPIKSGVQLRLLVVIQGRKLMCCKTGISWVGMGTKGILRARTIQ